MLLESLNIIISNDSIVRFLNLISKYQSCRNTVLGYGVSRIP